MLYYFVYILLISYTLVVSKRALHMLQQNLYNENNRYLKWVFKNLNTTIINVSILSIFTAIVILLTNSEFIVNLLFFLLLFIYLVSYFK